MKKILKGTAIFGIVMVAFLGLLVALSVWETTGPYNEIESHTDRGAERVKLFFVPLFSQKIHKTKFDK